MILICAKRDMGKSTLIYWLCYVNHKLFFMPIGMSNVAESVKDMERCFPQICVYDRFDEASLVSLKVTLDELRKDKNWFVPNFLIVLDDVSDGKKTGALYTKVMRDISLTGRHVNATIALAIQNAVQVDKEFRQNIDIFVMGKEANLPIRRTLFQEFFAEQFNNDFGEFCNACNRLTSRYRWMVYYSQFAKKCEEEWNEEEQRMITTAEQCIFIIRAKPADDVPHFRVGDRDIWLINRVYGVHQARVQAGTYMAKMLGFAGGAGEGAVNNAISRITNAPSDVRAASEINLHEDDGPDENELRERKRDADIKKRINAAKKNKKPKKKGKSKRSKKVVGTMLPGVSVIDMALPGTLTGIAEYHM